MSSLPSLGQYTLACGTHTALIGEQREITVADHLRKIDEQVEFATTQHDLAPHQADEYRQHLIDSLRQQINDGFQSQVRFGSNPTTRTFVELNVQEAQVLKLLGEVTDTRLTNYKIFERDDKTYTDEAEREMWHSRIAMLERSLATTRLFSLSIIPSDPSEKQTWYHKASISYKLPERHMLPWEVLKHMIAQDNVRSAEATSSSTSSSPTSSSSASKAPQNLFELKPPPPAPIISTFSTELTQEEGEAIDSGFENLLPTIHDNGPTHPPRPTFHSFGSNITTGAQEESPDSPAPTFNGFFAPFAGFSSSIAHAQHDPQHLARSVTRVNVFAMNEMENVMRGLESDTVRNSIGGIVDAFVDDVHSRAIGLIVLEPRHHQIKTLFFEKAPN